MLNAQRYIRTAIAFLIGAVFGIWLLLIVASDSCLDGGGRVLNYGLNCEFEGGNIVHLTAIIGVFPFLFVLVAAFFVGKIMHRALLKWS
jgi:hypothetical protein